MQSMYNSEKSHEFLAFFGGIYYNGKRSFYERRIPMDLFSKCHNPLVEEARAKNIYPYFHEL